MKPTFLKYAGIIGILGGLLILTFTLTFVRFVTRLDMQSLISIYGPNDGRTYEDLYGLAKHIGGQRNYLEMLFFSTLGIASMILGVVLWMWARDIKRSQKKD